MTKCPSCFGTNDVIHESTGQRICQDCGTVLDENAIVSEVTFQENANGSTSVIGQFVSSAGPAKLSGVTARHGPSGHNRESREITMQNARRRLGQLTAALRLAQQNQDQALRIYELAVQSNFVQGRKSQHVVAACLYVVCRREIKPHMLIDFAEVLQTNVFALGATVMQLLRKLKLTIPLVDPSLYIVRFAHNLELGEYTHTVSQTALKIIAHMERDWMVTGRRPSGLCGAALIIASRMYNFKRSLKEVARVVRIGDFTLRRRLDEFQNSNAMDLSVEELDRLDADVIKKDPVQLDPPAFIRAQISDNIKRRMNELITTVPDLNRFANYSVSIHPNKSSDESLSTGDKEGVVKTLPEGSLSILQPKYSLVGDDETGDDSPPVGSQSLSEALENPLTREMAQATLEKTAMQSIESVKDILTQIRSVFSNNLELNEIYSALDEAFKEGQSTELHETPEGSTKRKKGSSKSSSSSSSSTGEEDEETSENSEKGKASKKNVNNGVATVLADGTGDKYMSGLRAVLGTESVDEKMLELVEAALSQRSIPLTKLVEMRGERTAAEIVEKDKEAERARQILRVCADMEAWNAEREIDTLSDVDDDEVQSAMLTPEESKAKAESWSAVYQDYMDAMERKRKLEEEQQRMGIRPARKSKSRRGALDVGLPLSRIEKRVSDRIDYRALDLISSADPLVANALARSIPHTPNFRADGPTTPQLRTPIVGGLKQSYTPKVQQDLPKSQIKMADGEMDDFSLGFGATSSSVKMQPAPIHMPARPSAKLKTESDTFMPTTSLASSMTSSPFGGKTKMDIAAIAPVKTMLKSAELSSHAPFETAGASKLSSSEIVLERASSSASLNELAPSTQRIEEESSLSQISLTQVPSLINLSQPTITTTTTTTATATTADATTAAAAATTAPRRYGNDDDEDDGTFGLGRKKSGKPNIGMPVAPKRPRR